MDTPRFTEGQRVRIVPLVGNDGHTDILIMKLAGETASVVRSYCVTRDEMPELSKMFIYPDVFSYDVRLDGNGEVVRGIPEAALESFVGLKD